MVEIIDFLMGEFELTDSAMEVFALTFALLTASTIFDLIVQTFGAIYRTLGGK